MEIACIDPNATGYGTFQSHNQKVLWNRHGIFTTHIRTRNEPYTAQTWRLSRSEDGGKTFSTVYEATHATNPPVIETDEAGNVYLTRADFVDGNAYLYRFLAEKDFKDPAITTISGGAAGKYAMAIDLNRRRLYFFSHNNTFHVLDLSGKLLSSRTLLKAGKNGVLQYPCLAVGDHGELHAAWTTQKHGVYLYWDIHHMLSRDGGVTWHILDGTRVEIPCVADDGGAAMRVTLDDEFEVHTWLSSMAVSRGKVHFMYLAQSTPPRERYVRYDIATGRKEIDIRPDFRGQSLSAMGLDGLLAVGPNRRSPLYAVGMDLGKVTCLISRDNGQTWKDHAVSAKPYATYAIGGCRTTMPDGSVIGTFTAREPSADPTNAPSKVWFFRIRPKPSS